VGSSGSKSKFNPGGNFSLGQEALREQQAQGLLTAIWFHSGLGGRPNEAATLAMALRSVLHEAEQGVWVELSLETRG